MPVNTIIAPYGLPKLSTNVESFFYLPVFRYLFYLGLKIFSYFYNEKLITMNYTTSFLNKRIFDLAYKVVSTF